MPDPFVPSDLLRYNAIAGVTASSSGHVACVVEAPDEPNDSNSSKIWLVPLDGAAPRLFTSGTDSAPKWSPEGSELAFVSNRGGSGLQAFVIRADGGEAKTATKMKGGVYSVEWSPNGGKLL